ncbi:hypothetical protein ACYZTR_13150 [Pseudomonas sp. Hz4]
MSTDRQKSFTARLRFGEFSVCFLELSLKPEAISGKYSGRVNAAFSSGAGFAQFVESDYLCMNNKLLPNSADLLYFRYVDGGYHIIVREPSPNYGKHVGYSGGWLKASNDPALWYLSRPENDTQRVTLDDLGEGGESELILRCGHGIMGRGPYQQVDNSLSYAYLGTNSDECDLPFMFKIIERNVPYVSKPDEV